MPTKGRNSTIYTNGTEKIIIFAEKIKRAMKKFFYLVMIAWLSVPAIFAQNSTSGKDFWVTFGKNNTMMFIT